MKVFILGSGETALELAALLEARNVAHDVLALEDLELAQPMELVRALTSADADQVVHLPGCDDFLEVEHDAAAAARCELLNSAWISALAETCSHLNLPLFHLSSSLVFDGAKKAPYTEEDQCNPQGRYGALMWRGEQALRETHERHLILRADWLFGQRDTDWIRRRLEDCRARGGKLALLDRRFSPTPAADLARVLLALLQQVDCHAQVWGTYHYCALQPVSEAQHVENLVREAARFDPEMARLAESLEITLGPPPRPWIPNSALNCQKIMETFGIKQRSRAPALAWLMEELYQVPHAQAQCAPPPVPDEAAPAPRERGKRKKLPRKSGARKRIVEAESGPATEPPAKKAAEKKP